MLPVQCVRCCRWCRPMRPTSATRATPVVQPHRTDRLPRRRARDCRDHARRRSAALMTMLALVGIARRHAGRAKGPDERLMSRPALMRLAARELSPRSARRPAGLDRVAHHPCRRVRCASPRPARSTGPSASGSSIRHAEPGEGRFLVSAARSRQADGGVELGDRRGRRARAEPAAGARLAVTGASCSRISRRRWRRFRPRSTADRRPTATAIDVAVTKAIEIARQRAIRARLAARVAAPADARELPSAAARRRDWPEPHPHAHRPGDCRVAERSTSPTCSSGIGAKRGWRCWRFWPDVCSCSSSAR